MQSDHTPIAQAKLALSSALLRALTHPLRMQIVSYLRDRTAATVQEIADSMELDQSITSQHLRILKQVALVSSRREGKYVSYTLARERLRRVTAAVDNFLATDGKQALA